MANLTFLMPVLLLAFFVREGEPVRCWACSSDLNPKCEDPFIGGRLETSNLFRLDNCDANTGTSYPYLKASKSVCKKHIKYINGERVVIRGCTWKQNRDDYSTSCPSAANRPNEVTTFCETCEHDGCNGAVTLGRTLALLVAPLGLLLFK